MSETTNIQQMGIGNVKYTLANATEMAIRKNTTKQKNINKPNWNIYYHHIENGLFGGGVATTLNTILKNYKHVNLLHNLSQNPIPIGWIKGWNENIITIGTAHELAEISFPDLARQAVVGLKGELWRKTITLPGIRSLLACDYTCATSQLIKKGLIKAGYLKENIFMTPLGVDPAFINSPIKKKENKFFTIGTLGCQGPQKNTFFTIQAFKHRLLASERLEIWGNSIYSQKELQEAIGANPRIYIPGPAPEATKVYTYDQFDVFVFPSLFEGFGIPIIEAKARGLPVILYKEGKISPEIKKYCFLAKDPEHMAELIGQIRYNGYDEKQRKKAMEDAQKYTLKRTGQSILKAYEKILG